MIKRVLLDLYTALLRLYPRQFRQDFAAEMQTVFSDALGCAHREGLWAILRLCLREARELPNALVCEHWQSVSEKEAGMVKKFLSMVGKGNVEAEFEEKPAHGWGEIFLAMLPFLLILLVDVLPNLLVESGLLTWEAKGMKVMNTTLAMIMAGALLGFISLARHRKWADWSATWYVFFVLAVVMLVGTLLSVLYQEDPNFVINQALVIYFILPLIPAVLLYTVTRRDPLRGLLAALPLLYLLWSFENMEFVPGWIEIFVKIPCIALVCLTVAFLLRRGNWRTGLYAVLATNLTVGFLFCYAGIYHGGTLPSVARGPNLAEVLRSLLPQFLMAGAILVGPLFALKIRQAGRSGGLTGRVGYHLALAGLLLVILANLVRLILGTEPKDIASSDRNALTAAIIMGLGIYLLGLFFVYRDTLLARKAPGWVPPKWALRLLLAFLPLAIPLTFMLPFITWKRPISDLYGTPLLWELPHALSLSIGLIWLALSVWVVTQGEEATMPTAARGVASEAPPLS